MTKLDELDRLLAKATPGPWTKTYFFGQAESKCECLKKGELLASVPQDEYPGAGPFHYHADMGMDDGHKILTSPGGPQVAGNYDWDVGGIVRTEDRDLIVATHNALPALLAVAEAARSLVDAEDGDIAMARLRNERFEALVDALAALGGAE